MAVAQRYLPAYQSPTYQVALEALEAGMSVLPIRPDGTKQPALPGWKRYQQELPTEAFVEEWFRLPQRGLALVTGHISGGLIALDAGGQHTFAMSPQTEGIYRGYVTESGEIYVAIYAKDGDKPMRRAGRGHKDKPRTGTTAPTVVPRRTIGRGTPRVREPSLSQVVK